MYVKYIHLPFSFLALSCEVRKDSFLPLPFFIGLCCGFLMTCFTNLSALTSSASFSVMLAMSYSFVSLVKEDFGIGVEERKVVV